MSARYPSAWLGFRHPTVGVCEFVGFGGDEWAYFLPTAPVYHRYSTVPMGWSSIKPLTRAARELLAWSRQS